MILYFAIVNTITYCKVYCHYSKKLNKTVVLNPSPAVKIDKEFLSSADILIPNETEINIIGMLNIFLTAM